MRLLALIIFLFIVKPASATWSIIVADAKTGRIGMAAASCTPSVYGIGTIVPGKGAIIVQAYSNDDAREKGAAMIKAGATAEQILTELGKAFYEPYNQQYGIICLNDPAHPLSYTGDSTYPNKASLTAPGITVQGNVMAHPGEAQQILQAAIDARNKGLPLEEILMLAMEAGAKAGGDWRCCETQAHSAFLTVMNPADDPGKPFLNLIVDQIDDNTNAIVLLREKMNSWKKQQ